jgi:hypothetical protein
MKDKSETINHPAVSIVGACTPEALFEALRPSDVEGGFANRLMLLPFEGFKRPPEREAPEGSEEPPASLVGELRRLLPAKASILDSRADEEVGQVRPEDREKIVWDSEEAKAAYFEFSREVDQWEDKDRQRFELGMRAAENAVRCATDVAAGCFSPTVDVGDIEWALRWSRVSFEAAVGGVNKYMNQYFEFPKLCEKVEEKIGEAGGFMSHRDLRRAFRKYMRRGDELDKVLVHLVREGRLREGQGKKGKTGPAPQGYWLVDADESPE